MTAFIEIHKVGEKGDTTFVNNQVSDINDCVAWFELNMDYLEKIAKRKNVDLVRCYVKNNDYYEIYTYTV